MVFYCQPSCLYIFPADISVCDPHEFVFGHPFPKDFLVGSFLCVGEVADDLAVGPHEGVMIHLSPEPLLVALEVVDQFD